MVAHHVIPATQEAEAGELLEFGRQRLQWAEIAPLNPGGGGCSELRSCHYTPSWAAEWDFVSKKKKEKEKKNILPLIIIVTST